MRSNRPIERHSSLPGQLTPFPPMPARNLPTELIRRASSDDGRSAKRPRASKPKVRSGCITCKTRRVKCDENKPQCLRCLNFGRTCDGYLPEPSQSRGLIQLQPRIPPVSLYGPNTSIHTTEEESRYYQTFSDQTAFELPGFYDSTFWTSIVLQESHNVAAIRHAVIALGALTKSLETAPSPGLKVNDIEAIDTRHHKQAINFNLRAIQELNHYLSSSNSPQLRYALITCLLFVCFETFQGSYASSIQQTYGGLKILRSHYMGKPGSRPWIPRPILPESSKKARNAIDVAKALQTREGCDNVSKERSIVQHVEEYLENENNVEMDVGEKSSVYETEPRIVMSPEYLAYAKHVEIPGMSSPESSKRQRHKMELYPATQASRSQHIDSPIFDNNPVSQSCGTPDVQQMSTSAMSSLISTPGICNTQSARQSPSALPSTQVSSTSRKRPLASRSPTPNALQNDLTIEEDLIQSFVRLDGQGLFFGMIPGIPPLIWDIHGVYHLPIPQSFPDFPTAQRCWDFLMDRALQFYRRTLFNRVYAPSASDRPALISRHYDEYTKELVDFEKAFQSILDGAIDQDGTVINAAALVLSLYLKCTRIVLSTILSNSEMRYDSFLNDFQYITPICKILVECQDTLQRPRNKRFSLDTGIIPPLHVVATKCRDPVVRREAIDLLFASPRQEGMWDGVLSARIGLWIVTCEEEGLPAYPIDPRQEKQDSESEDVQSPYPSLPHNAEELGGWKTGRRISEVVMTEHLGNGVAEYGPAAEGGKLLNSAGIRGQIVPGRRKTAEEKSTDQTASKGWIVPEENRVQLTVVDFHIPDRHIRVKCQRVLVSEDGTRVERETIIAW